jgi:hypothetical protein
MVLLLPAETTGLVTLEERLDTGTLDSILVEMSVREFQLVLLPRFKMTRNVRLEVDPSR